jgi:hypothetical protein
MRYLFTMKRYFILPGVAAALLGAALAEVRPREAARPLRQPAAARPGDSVALPDPSSIRRQYMGTVAQVSREERSFLVDDSSLGTQKLYVDERTQFFQGDQRARWRDVKVGATVDGTCLGTSGNAYAETVNIGR